MQGFSSTLVGAVLEDGQVRWRRLRCWRLRKRVVSGKKLDGRWVMERVGFDIAPPFLPGLLPASMSSLRSSRPKSAGSTGSQHDDARGLARR